MGLLAAVQVQHTSVTTRANAVVMSLLIPSDLATEPRPAVRPRYSYLAYEAAPTRVG